MSGNLSVYTLGGLTIQRGGKPVSALHSRKAQALLVYLAVTGRPQSREVLADLLWEDFSQQKAMNNLRVVLSSLRKQLGEHLQITRDKAGMNPEVDYDLDVAVLDANLDNSRKFERKTGGLDGETAARIEQAVELYKGEFLKGFFVEKAPEFDAWMVVERERLHLSVLDGLGKLVRWELSRGDYTAGIRHASRWVQLDLLSEPAHRGMMRLLALSGQRSAALAQYEKCRDILATELGVEPDTSTTALHEQIVAGTLAPDEILSRPIPHAESVRPDAHRHNLPVQTTSFVGREVELAELKQLLTDPDVRLVTVVGAGGMGKTRLAMEAGSELLEQFPDGVFFVDLARLQSEHLIVPTIIQALEIEFAGGGSRGGESPTVLKEILLGNLYRKQLLLILDNFEHLLDGANLVGEIIQAAPAVKALATSRSRLKISGEHRFQVAGMDYPEDIQDAGAQKYSAVRLFLECARRARSGYKLRPDDMLHIIRICRMVEGMPLGIRLAAAWVETLSPEEIAVEIARNLDLLETDLRDVPERQRSIRALFDHSWGLLSAQEREVFQGFSVFRGGGSREAVQQITGATLGDLRDLVGKSLLQRALSGRYETHELAREYAAEKLQGNLEASEKAYEKHSTYYCIAVEKWGHDLKYSRQETALTEFDLEIENARTAWNWAVEHRRVDLLDKSIEGFRHYFEIRIRWQEAERAFHQAAENFESATSVNERRVYARLLSLQGHCTYGDERKWQLYHQSLEVIKQLEELGRDVRYEKAWTLNIMGELASMSDFEGSLRFYRQSLRIFEQLGDRYWASHVLYGLGTTHYLWGKIEQALNYDQQSLAYFRELGDLRKIAHNLIQFEYIYDRQGEFEKAERIVRERLEIYERIGDPSLIAFGQGDLGACFWHLGEFEAAEALLENAIQVHQEQEHIGAFFLRAIELCFVKLELGAYNQAYDLAQSAMAWSGGRIFPLPGWAISRDSEPRRIGITLTVQGMASLSLGNLAEAELLLRRSSKILLDIHPITYTTFHHPALGIVSLSLNQPDRAKVHIRDGLKIGLQIGSAMVHLYSLGAAALYLAGQGDLERGVEIYALARRYPWIAKSKWHQEFIEAPLSAMTASLSPEIITAAQVRGQERDLEATVQELFAQLA